MYLKDYSIGPIQALVDIRTSGSVQPQSILTFGFLIQIIIVILNLVIIFFAILKLHDQLESKNLQ